MVEDALDIPALFHADDAQLVLLVDPHQEGLVVVEEDAAAFGPIIVDARRFQEAVALFEQEMVRHELRAVLLRHTLEREVLTFEVVVFEALENGLHLLLELDGLFLVHSTAQRVTRDVPRDADSLIVMMLQFMLGMRHGLSTLVLWRESLGAHQEFSPTDLQKTCAPSWVLVWLENPK